MELPFAVYTARQGYAWQSGIEYGIQKLELFRKAIGKMPEFDFGERASCGLLNVVDMIVAYRFMRQEKADFKGRDAGYLALTFCSREDARFIDAEAMLTEYPFATPLMEPPSSFEYAGGPAMPTEFSLPVQASTGCFNNERCMSAAGFVFAQTFEGTLRIFREEPSDAKGAQFRYELPPKPLVIEKEPEQRPVITPEPMTKQEPVAQSNDLWKWVAIVAMCIAILEAAIITVLLLPLRANDKPVPTPVSSVLPQIELKNKEESQDAQDAPQTGVKEANGVEHTKKP